MGMQAQFMPPQPFPNQPYGIQPQFAQQQPQFMGMNAQGYPQYQ